MSAYQSGRARMAEAITRGEDILSLLERLSRSQGTAPGAGTSMGAADLLIFRIPRSARAGASPMGFGRPARILGLSAQSLCAELNAGRALPDQGRQYSRQIAALCQVVQARSRWLKSPLRPPRRRLCHKADDSSTLRTSRRKMRVYLQF